MARDLTSGMAAQVSASALRPLIFGKFEFDSGDLNLFTGYGTFSWNGDDYTGTGDLAQISSVSETSDLRADSLACSLMGVDSSVLALALGEDYQERPATFWLGCLDDNDAIVADPYAIYKGRMDTMTLTEDADNPVIELNIVNMLAGLDRSSDRYYTDEDQHIDDPTDKFYSFVVSLNDGREVVWG